MIILVVLLSLTTSAAANSRDEIEKLFTPEVTEKLFTPTATGKDRFQQTTPEFSSSTTARSTNLPIIINDAVFRDVINLHTLQYMTERKQQEHKCQGMRYNTESAALRAKEKMTATLYPPTSKELNRQLKNCAKNAVMGSVVYDDDATTNPTTNDQNGDEENKTKNQNNRPNDNLYERCVGEGSVLVVGKCSRCCRNCSNWVMTGGTGFAVSKTGIVATNHHVLEDKEKDPIQDGIVLAIDQNLNVYPVVQVLAADKHSDACLVQLAPGRRTSSKGWQEMVDDESCFPPPIPLSKRHVPIGSSVTVISNPGSNHFMLTKGVAARYAYFYTDDEIEIMRKEYIGGMNPFSSRRINCDSRYRLDITADFALGSSGAPVLNDDGEVVGMVCMTFPLGHQSKDENNKQVFVQQMVKKSCVPSSDIFRLLSQINT